MITVLRDSLAQNQPTLQDTQPKDKRYWTLAAHAALAGHQFQRTGDGFRLHRWSWSRHFTDLAEAEAVISRLGRPS